MIDINKIVSLNNDWDVFLKNYNSEIPLVFYGCGAIGLITFESFKNYNIKPVAVCDSNNSRIGTLYNGMIIESFENVLEKYPNLIVVICAGTKNHYVEIKKYIKKFISDERIYSFAFGSKNIKSISQYKDFILKNKDNINSIYNILFDDISKNIFEKVLSGVITNKTSYFEDICSEDQYFTSFMKLDNDEVFVDCGAFTGDTFFEFNTKTKGNFKKYYGFEPDNESYNMLISACDLAKNRVSLFNSGVFETNTTLYFESNDKNPPFSKITDDSNIKIKVVKLDDLIDDEVTFIKMDVEGSELSALKGAEGLIRKYKPKLAICVYHKVDDILEIPKWIMSLGLDYRYYLRHHTYTQYETVFYAV